MGERKPVWGAHPPEVLWYGQIVYDWPDAGDCDYAYGYSAQADEPDEKSLDELLPAGRVILERVIRPTPQNPLWTPDEESEES